MPRVTVVIPAYNAEPYIAETLASVEAQTYPDWHVVVADDGSTDDTVTAARAFGERYTVLTGAAKEGPAGARNRALAAADGELVAFLDADDLWHPTYLERMVALHDAGVARALRVGVVSCDARILGPQGYLPKTYAELNGAAGGVTLERMLFANPIFVAAISPRAVVEEAGGFCTDLFGTEDYDLWLRILERGYEIVATSEPLAVYRLREASVSTNLERMARSFQLTYSRALERGRLTPRQARIARRQLRLQRALEQLGVIRSGRYPRGRTAAQLAAALPLFARVAAENPDRWLSALRTLSGHGSPLAQVSK